MEGLAYHGLGEAERRTDRLRSFLDDPEARGGSAGGEVKNEMGFITPGQKIEVVVGTKSSPHASTRSALSDGTGLVIMVPYSSSL